MIFDSGGHWRSCESLEETAEGRRSICVLTQITAFTATWKQQTELSSSILIMQLSISTEEFITSLIYSLNLN